MQVELRSKPPTNLRIEDLNSALIGDFLAHVEKVRHNSARSRNTRLAAIRSFYRYVAMNEPEHALHCQRILAMPNKRYVRRTVDFIDRTEMEALLSAPDLSTWIGRRDRAILLLALQTGLRVSELINLDCCDVALGTGAHVRCEGKGRKQRSTPLRRDAVRSLEAWLKERSGNDDDPPLPDDPRGPAQPRCRGAHRPKMHVGGFQGVRIVERKARKPAHPASLDGDGPASKRRG